MPVAILYLDYSQYHFPLRSDQVFSLELSDKLLTYPCEVYTVVKILLVKHLNLVTDVSNIVGHLIDMQFKSFLSVRIFDTIA